MPVDVMYGMDCLEGLHVESSPQWLNRLWRGHVIVREKIGMQQERQKEYYDRNVLGEPPL